MSDTENAIPRPLGWSVHDRAVQHHSISLLSIQVTRMDDGERYLEVVKDDAVVLGQKLTTFAATDLARLLTD